MVRCKLWRRDEMRNAPADFGKVGHGELPPLRCARGRGNIMSNSGDETVDAAVRIINTVHNRSGADAALRVAKQIITAAATSIAQIRGPDETRLFLYNTASQFPKNRARRSTPREERPPALSSKKRKQNRGLTKPD
jgi:hypothetical protein